jgi:hypothetical protein
MAVVRLLGGEGHAVLTVVTDRGDYVLDNITDHVLGWQQTHYQWIERQDMTRKSGWVMLQALHEDVLTSSVGSAPNEIACRRGKSGHTNR